MWVDDIPTQVLSRLKYDSKMLELQRKYPNFTLTTSDESSTPTKFPTLILRKLESPEVGQDLENTTINGINAGFQIDVIDNEKKRTRVKEIMEEVKRIMKSMRFNLRDAPDMDTNDEKRSILRATRYITENDIFNMKQ